MDNSPISETSETYAGLLKAVSGDRMRVTSKQANLLLYQRDFTCLPEKGSPQAVVYPESVDEVRRILAEANARRVPVVNYSAGTGLGTWLAREGGVQLDMRRMNRIVEINEECHYAVVEPGVTYAKLTEALVPRGLVVSIPDAPPVASVLSNHLGFGLGAYAQLHGTGPELLLGLEVVLPNGQVVRTGGAALGDTGWHTRSAFYPIPDITGMFAGAFGTLGVVTKAAVRLFPMPAEVSYRKVGFNTVAAAVDAVRECSNRGLVDRAVAFSWYFSTEAVKVFGPRIDGTPLTEAEEAALRKQVNVPECYLFLGIHGEPSVVAARNAKLDDALAKHKAIAMEMSPIDTEKYHSVAKGVPQTVSEKSILGRKGKYEGGYDTIVVYTPLSKWTDLYREWSRIGRENGHPLAMNAKVFGDGRYSSFRFIMSYFDPNDVADRKRMTKVKEECAAIALEMGIPTSAASPALLPELASFPLYKILKQALDPNNIMHPVMTGDSLANGSAAQGNGQTAAALSEPSAKRAWFSPRRQ